MLKEFATLISLCTDEIKDNTKMLKIVGLYHLKTRKRGGERVFVVFLMISFLKSKPYSLLRQ